MGSFSIWHWAIVLLIVVMVFGTKKLRNMGGDLGGAVKGFKDGMKDGTDKAAEAGAAASAAATPQVGGSTTAVKTAANETIDVEAKSKS